MNLIDLGLIMRNAPPWRLEAFMEPLNTAMYDWYIDEQKARMAAFLATVAVESGELRYTREIASGEAYEGRVDLGNTKPGDGKRFPGRGLIQITGRANTEECSLALYGDTRLLANPELLEQPGPAADSAGWFFFSRGLNTLADAGEFHELSCRVNGRNKATGDPNNWTERAAFLTRGRAVLGVDA